MFRTVLLEGDVNGHVFWHNFIIQCHEGPVPPWTQPRIPRCLHHLPALSNHPECIRCACLPPCAVDASNRFPDSTLPTVCAPSFVTTTSTFCIISVLLLVPSTVHVIDIDKHTLSLLITISFFGLRQEAPQSRLPS